jgi:hypothetical protein
MSSLTPARGSPAIVDSGAASKNGAIGDVFIVYEVLFVSTGEIQLRLTQSTSGSGWDGEQIWWFGLTATVNGGTTYTIPNDYVSSSPHTLVFPTVRWNAQTTVFLSGTVRGLATDNDGDEQRADKALPGSATTYNMKTVASLTGPLLTTTSGSPVITVTDTTSSSNLLHIKHLGTGRMTIWGLTVDGDSSSLQIPSMGGLTLFQTIGGGTTYSIASYYAATLTTGTTAVTATTATSPIVLANINSTDKTVGLPNPATFQSSYLCVCGYGTGTSTPTGKLYVLTNNYSTEASGSTKWFRFDPAGRSVGVLFVSDGSKWHVVGVYLGGVTTYDTTTTQYTTVTSTIALASSSSANAISPGSVTTADSGIFQIWKAIANPFAASAVIGNGTNYVINSSANRLYRNDGADFTSFIYVNTKVGAGGTPTVFPVAQYPAEK